MPTNRTQSSEDRRQTIQKLWQENQWLYVLIGVFIGLVLSQFYSIEIASFVQNLIPEAVGIGFTVLVIDLLNQRRDERHRIRELKDKFLRDANSKVNSFAIKAIEEIKAYQWLVGDGGILQGTNFAWADLKGAYLHYANLKNVLWVDVNLADAYLTEADLSGATLEMCKLQDASLGKVKLNDADLSFANFNGAKLAFSNLNNAKLYHTDLSNADLTGAQLREAVLTGCNLKGAILTGVKLEGASIYSVQVDETTIMPDGNHYQVGGNLRLFT